MKGILFNILIISVFALFPVRERRWQRDYMNRLDEGKSLLDGRGSYTIEGFSNIPAGKILEATRGRIVSQFKIDNEDVGVVVPVQMVPGTEVTVSLTDEIRSLKNERTVKGISLSFKHDDAREIVLEQYHGSEEKINPRHSLTCRGLRKFGQQTTLVLNYKHTTKTVEVQFLNQDEVIRCSSENFIEVPEEVILEVNVMGRKSIIEAVGVTKSEQKAKSQHKKSKKSFTLEEIKDKDDKQLLAEIYEGIEELYAPVMRVHKNEFTQQNHLKDASKYMREILLPRADLDEPVNLGSVEKKLNEIRIDDNVEMMKRLKAFTELDNIEIKKPSTNSNTKLYIIIGIQLLTIAFIFSTIRRRHQKMVLGK